MQSYNKNILASVINQNQKAFGEKYFSFLNLRKKIM
jgi:hypothetical protein